MAAAFLKPTVVPVDPTPTEVLRIDVRDTRLLAITVKNLDVSQVVTCTVERRAFLESDFVPTTLGDLSDIQPGLAGTVDVDSGAHMEVRVMATASGLGCDVEVSARNDGGRRP